MELPLDHHERNFDTDSAQNLRIERRVLTSTETPVQEGYCVAVMRDGALHLTPVNAVYQMRPSLSHLDAADERKREAEKVGETRTHAQSSARSCDPSRYFGCDPPVTNARL